MNRGALQARLTLAGVVLLFALPFGLAGLWHWEQWRPAGTVNHGTLVVPPREVTTRGLQARDGKPLPRHFFQRRWTLVLLGTPPCASVCRAALYKMRQSRLALGKDMRRVQRLYVVPDSAANRERLAEVMRQHAGLRLARAQPAWLAVFSVADQPAERGNRIYLVDPRGYLMMHYAANADARGMLKDLERLLKVSRLG